MTTVMILLANADGEYPAITYDTVDMNPHFSQWKKWARWEVPFHLCRVSFRGWEEALAILEQGLNHLAGTYGFVYTSTPPVILAERPRHERLRDAEAQVFQTRDGQWVAATLVFPMKGRWYDWGTFSEK